MKKLIFAWKGTAKSWKAIQKCLADKSKREQLKNSVVVINKIIQ